MLRGTEKAIVDVSVIRETLMLSRFSGLLKEG